MAEDYTAYMKRKAAEKTDARGNVTPFLPHAGYSSDKPGEAAGGLPSGFRSGANQPGGVAAQKLNLAKAAGTGLGEPTSFAGGVGAPAGIPVMRGTTTTFQPVNKDESGHFASPEMATPLQAQQEYNRFMLQRNLASVAMLPGEAEAPGAQAGAREALTEKYGEFRGPGQTLAEIAA